MFALIGLERLPCKSVVKGKNADFVAASVMFHCKSLHASLMAELSRHALVHSTLCLSCLAELAG